MSCRTCVLLTGVLLALFGCARGGEASDSDARAECLDDADALELACEPPEPQGDACDDFWQDWCDIGLEAERAEARLACDESDVGFVCEDRYWGSLVDCYTNYAIHTLPLAGCDEFDVDDCPVVDC